MKFFEASTMRAVQKRSLRSAGVGKIDAELPEDLRRRPLDCLVRNEASSS